MSKRGFCMNFIKEIIEDLEKEENNSEFASNKFKCMEDRIVLLKALDIIRSRDKEIGSRVQLITSVTMGIDSKGATGTIVSTGIMRDYLIRLDEQYEEYGWKDSGSQGRYLYADSHQIKLIKREE